MVDDVSDEEEAEEPTKVNPQPDAKLLETLAAPPGAGASRGIGPGPGAAAPARPSGPGSTGKLPAVGPGSVRRAPIVVPSVTRTGANAPVGGGVSPLAKTALGSRPGSSPDPASSPSPSTRGLSVPTQAGLGDAASKALSAGEPKPASSRPGGGVAPSVAAKAAPAKSEPKLPDVRDSEPPDSGGGGTLIIPPGQGGVPAAAHAAGGLDQTLAFGQVGAPGGPGASPYGSPLGSPAADAAWSTQGQPAGGHPYPSVQGHVMGQGGMGQTLALGGPQAGSTLPHDMPAPGMPPGYGPPGAPYGAPYGQVPQIPQSGSMPGYGMVPPVAPSGYVPPAPGTHGHGPAPMAEDGRRLPLGVLVGVGLALLLVAAGTLAYFLLRSPDEVAATDPTPVVAPAETATAAPVATPAPTPAPTPEPARAAEPAPTPEPEPVKPAPEPVATAKAAPAPVAPAPVAPATARPTTPTPAAAPTPKQVTPAPAADTSGWNEQLAKSRLTQANGILSFCKKEGGVTGPGKANVTFTNDGSVSTVNMEPPYAGTREGDCAAGQFKRAKVPPFEGPPRVVRHSFEIPK